MQFPPAGARGATLAEVSMQTDVDADFYTGVTPT